MGILGFLQPKGGPASAEVTGPWKQRQIAPRLTKVTFPIPVSHGTPTESHHWVEFPRLRPLCSLPGSDEEIHPLSGMTKKSGLK